MLMDSEELRLPRKLPTHLGAIIIIIMMTVWYFNDQTCEKLFDLFHVQVSIN